MLKMSMVKAIRKTAFNTGNTVQYLQQRMILKGRRVVQHPSPQINLHKVLDLSTGSSIATLERRNLEPSTWTSINFRQEKKQNPSWHFCLFEMSHPIRLMQDFRWSEGDLLSIKALTKPRWRPQFGCSVDRNSTTVWVNKHSVNQKALKKAKVTGKWTIQ